MSYTSRGWTARTPTLLTLDSAATLNSSADLLSFLATAQALNVEILSITWDAARQHIGSGATSQIRESLVNLHTSFAFKRFHDVQLRTESQEEDIFRALTNEILVLGNRAVREHPNIVQLQGVCWDIDTNDRPWPVIALEKSQYGDLSTFATLPVGRKLTFQERVQICVDIGASVMDMHSNNIVHGDLKPENVLISRDEHGAFIANVTDFGYSTRYISEEQRIRLPKSIPWNAPENDRSAREWKPSEARKTDIYSFGLLCFWLLFEPYLCGLKPLPQGSNSEWSQHINTSSSLSNRAVASMAALKDNGCLTMCSRNLLSENPDHDVVLPQLLAIEDFLASSLRNEPEARTARIQRLADELNFIKHNVAEGSMPVLEDEASALAQHFKVEDSIDQLYDCDYRVRSYIGQKLISAYGANPEFFTQASICYYMGFGVPRDELRATDILKANSAGPDVLSAIVARCRTGSIKARPESLQTLSDQNHLTVGDLSYTYLDADKLKDVETYLLRELEDLTAVYSGEGMRLIHTIRCQLRTIYNIQGRWQDAANVATEDLKDCKARLGETHQHTFVAMANVATAKANSGHIHEAAALEEQVLSIIMRAKGPKHQLTLLAKSNLATTSLSMGNYQRAEEWMTEALQGMKETLGEEHPSTLSAMTNLAAILWEQGQAEEGLRLEMQALEKRLQVLGERHPDTMLNISNVALSLFTLKKGKEAMDYQISVVRLMREVLGAEHPDTLTVTDNLSQMLGHSDMKSEGERLESQVLDKRRALLGNDHPDTLRSIGNVAGTLESHGQVDEAISMLEECLAGRKKVLGADHSDTLKTQRALAVWRQTYRR